MANGKVKAEQKNGIAANPVGNTKTTTIFYVIVGNLCFVRVSDLIFNREITEDDNGLVIVDGLPKNTGVTAVDCLYSPELDKALRIRISSEGTQMVVHYPKETLAVAPFCGLVCYLCA